MITSVEAAVEPSVGVGGHAHLVQQESLARSWQLDFQSALPGWILTRAITLAAFALASRMAASRGYTRVRLEQGFLAWDGDRYLQIARDGYAAIAPSGKRFFPLFPLLARVGASAFGVSQEVALVALANIGALCAGALLHRLTLLETGDHTLARRVTWVLALSPTSFVLALGYTEGLAIALSALLLLSCRRERWGLAAVAGFAAALMRPTGILLALPAAWEAATQFRHLDKRQRVLALAAVAGPPAGCAIYLAWNWMKFGNPLQPFTIQQSGVLRGNLSHPAGTLMAAVRDLFTGEFALNGARAPFAILTIVLVVVCWRRLPHAYGILAIASVILMLSTEHWGSLERYALGSVPLVLAASVCLRRPLIARAAISLSAVTMFGYAVASFMGVLVP